MMFTTIRRNYLDVQLNLGSELLGELFRRRAGGSGVVFELGPQRFEMGDELTQIGPGQCR